MNLEEAIKTAIGYEARVLEVYQRFAGQTSDPAGKTVLGILAREEREHLDYLKSKLEEWKRSGRVTPQTLRSVIPPRDQIQRSIRNVESHAAVEDRAGELELLERALQMEKETESFYRQAVHQLDREGQKLFEPFLQIEEGHQLIVQAELDNLRGLGFWLDFQEFDMEAG